MGVAISNLFSAARTKAVAVARWSGKRDNALFLGRMGFLFLAATAAQAQDVATIEDSMYGNAGAWVGFALRFVGALMCLGGVFAAFKGVTGNEEGFQKVAIIGLGFLGIGLGGYLIASPAGIVSAVGMKALAAKM